MAVMRISSDSAPFQTTGVTSIHTLDGTSAGSMLGVSEEGDVADLKLTEKAFFGLMDVMKGVGRKVVDGFSLREQTIMSGKDVGTSQAVTFQLTRNSTKMEFKLVKQGNRGYFLNAWWSPTKFLTGQNVYPFAREEAGKLLGVGWVMRPGNVVEFPFKLLGAFLDRIVGGEWPGRSAIASALKKHSIYWRRMDFTLYSKPLDNPERVLEAIHSASVDRTVGLGSRDFQKMSLRTLLGIHVQDQGDDDAPLTYIRLNKMRMRDPKRKAKSLTTFSLAMYMKSAEVDAGVDVGNKKVMKTIAEDDIRKALRLEFTFYPQGVVKYAEFRDVLGLGSAASTSHLAVSQSKFLFDVFPEDEAGYREVSNGLLVKAMELLQFDWLISPQDSMALVRSLAGREDVPAAVPRILEEWVRLETMPLPGPRVAFSGFLDGQFSLTQVKDGYEFIRKLFRGDLTQLSYEMCTILYFNMVEACMTRKEAHVVKTSRADLRHGMISPEDYLSLTTSILDKSHSRFEVMRREVRANLGTRALARELLAGK